MVKWREMTDSFRGKASTPKIKLSLVHLRLAVVVRNHLMSHGEEAAVSFQKPLVSILLSGFMSLNKGLDYNFNGLFTGCVKDLSCHSLTVTFLSAALPAAKKIPNSPKNPNHTHTKTPNERGKKQPPQALRGHLSTSQPVLFLSKDVTWLS